MIELNLLISLLYLLILMVQMMLLLLLLLLNVDRWVVVIGAMVLVTDGRLIVG